VVQEERGSSASGIHLVPFYESCRWYTFPVVDRLLIAALAVAHAAHAQTPRGAFEFIQSIEGSGEDEVTSVATGPDGSLFIAGLTTSPI
jgi:hypothetical protein